eukprot:m.193972 g.193972  ORF g.193972 m.193972 type:complete len:54 (+) comp39485_c0_seq4:77-238(+)
MASGPVSHQRRFGQMFVGGAVPGGSVGKEDPVQQSDNEKNRCLSLAKSSGRVS